MKTIQIFMIVLFKEILAQFMLQKRFSGFDTPKIDKYTIYGETQEEIVFDNFDTSNITNINFMLAAKVSLPLHTLDLLNFDTRKVTNIYHMFIQCDCLTCLDLRSFNTLSVMNINDMLSDCVII